MDSYIIVEVVLCKESNSGSAFDDLTYMLGYKKLFLSDGIFPYYTHIRATVRREKLLYSIKFKFLISVFH